ncbi:MAG: CYCXC family (seleno)protein [Candidatus Aminicenantia bacterium]
MRSAQRKSMSSWMWLLVLAVVLIIGYFIGKGYRITAPENIETRPMSDVSKAKIPSVVLTAEALEIIKELNCACGSCGKKLVDCTCKIFRGADEMKRFIQSRVDEGLTKSIILDKVVERYGQAVLIKKEGYQYKKQSGKSSLKQETKSFLTLLPERFSGQTAEAYRIAQEIPDVLKELSCYCGCERIGHKNLLFCFYDEHGVGCNICQEEALEASKLYKKGFSAEEIKEKVVAKFGI